jgi:hypothetical protein
MPHQDKGANKGTFKSIFFCTATAQFLFELRKARQQINEPRFAKIFKASYQRIEALQNINYRIAFAEPIQSYTQQEVKENENILKGEDCRTLRGNGNVKIW